MSLATIRSIKHLDQESYLDLELRCVADHASKCDWGH